jgi:isocitrate/isopropylmalate dehydrogenase
MRDAGYRIALLPGDGTGPEVIHAGRRVLEAAAEGSSSPWTLDEYSAGATYYRDHGREWAPGAEEAARSADAILLGAVGWPGVSLPNGDIAGAGLIFGLRFGLDLFANVRPCRLYPGVLHRVSGKWSQVWTPQNVDFVIVRENTEGLYTPIRGALSRGGETEVAIDTRVITRKGAERVIRYAFELARCRDRGAPEDRKRRVTCVDKANVLRGCQFFRQIFEEVGAQYSDVDREYAYVDAFAQWMLRNPEHYDVVVTTNMFGDIVTDLAAVLQGGMGFAAGGNIGTDHAMFEPVHGSAPKHAGKNEINPFATFSAIEMMLRWLGEKHGDVRLTTQADRLERAMASVLAAGSARTYDQGGTVTTSEAGNRVAEALRSGERA